MSFTSVEFQSWSEKFEKSKGYLGTKTEAQWAVGTDKIPIKETLDQIAKLPDIASDLSADVLRKNIIYACFLAECASKIKVDPANMRRKRILGASAQIYKKQKAIREVAEICKNYSDVLGLIADYQDQIQLAGKPKRSIREIRHQEDVIVQIHDVLNRVLQGFNSAKKDGEPYYLDIVANEIEGPFFILNRAERRGEEALGKPRNYQRLVEDGLLFNLTYLFRYFTSSSNQRKRKVEIKVKGKEISKVVNQIPTAKLTATGKFAISGPMIAVGEPKNDLVAHLFNAVFPSASQIKAMTAQRVNVRLRTLLAAPRDRSKSNVKPGSESKGDKAKRKEPNFTVHFDGWPKPVCKEDIAAK